MSRNATRYNRNAQQAKQPKAKFEEQRQQGGDGKLGYHSIQLTQKQRQLGNLIRQNDLIFVEGPSGSGKSLGVIAEFVKQYLVDHTKQIIVIRTPVEAGTDKVGFLPSSLETKLEPHFAAARQTLDTLLSKEKVECDLDKRIKFMIPNFVLGCTLDNSLVLIDESQQIQPLILKLLLERIGKNSTVVVAGDARQLYVKDKSRNGLTDALGRFFRKDIHGKQIPRYEHVEHVEFEIEDVQRSELTKNVIRAYSDLFE